MPSETENDAYFDNEFFITNYVNFVEFYDNVAMIFSFVKNDNSYFEHTTSYINAFKKIEDDLPDFTDEYNHDTYVKYLKICYESIYLYINFLNDEKNYTILDNYQKIFDKIHHKLIDIEAFFDLNCEYFDKIGLRLNFFEFNDFKNDVIHFKKLIEQEVEHFKCYNDFRKEKFQNEAISTASKMFEFLEIFKSRVDRFSNMSKDDFKEIENPFNDDHIKEITDLFLEIFINIKNFEKIISNLFDSLNNIGEFEYRYIARLKSIFGSYESN
ncbi:hypothetical protein NBO_632g0001 [Nosema bombycis CQ1]|uniref:Uncharacterized protein n=1 Tax=Nosema bombycis (strain CQ1 / CVCC 102059) TaxID=578461 RepID=R0M1P3_NOSB1|nr:hypothetical protein NBO_632g0001 [Nosema bombycis CQ1]|eukprot:EOB11924.1 hypothetical protein NBO_632g0001 [Nosema bombycis CQ1]